MIYDLPESLTVCGTEYKIRSDFRLILSVLEMLKNKDMKEWERGYIPLLFFYEDFQNIPIEHIEEAKKQFLWFVNGGKHEDQSGKKPPRLMDWEQDYPYIIAPINRVLGHEIRYDAHLHWWTFLSAYMEIGECTFAQIVHIRDMQSKGKPLDKSDKEWYRRNQKLVDMETRLTSEEETVLKYWGGKNTPPSD